MARNELDEILESVPNEINHSDIFDFENFDKRMSAVGVMFANTIGMNLNSIEFCPNIPSSKEEVLSWIWSYRHDLAGAILEMDLSTDFRFLIESYRDSKMDEFWEEWS